MPVHKTKGGYKYGETGKTYKDKKSAIKQAIAIAYSKAEQKGRKPSQEEIHTEISGNPEKVASANDVNYNAYGLNKTAGKDDVYTARADASENDPSSFAYQSNENLRRAQKQGFKFGPGTELKVSWNPFVRSKTVYSMWNPFNWGRDERPGDTFTWNPFENLRATHWHPANWFKADLSEEAGDYIMDERRKQLAQQIAGVNSARYGAILADLREAGAENKRKYQETGTIRGSAYTDPHHKWRAEDDDAPRYEEPGDDRRYNGPRDYRRSSVGLPPVKDDPAIRTAPWDNPNFRRRYSPAERLPEHYLGYRDPAKEYYADRTYYSRGPHYNPNDEYQPPEEAMGHINDMPSARRRAYNIAKSAM